MTDHDKAIMEAAEKMAASDWSTASTYSNYQAVVAAVAAKRDAAKPKPLTAEEAYAVERASCKTPEYATADMPECVRLQAVLDAAMERAVKVIEARPEWQSVGPDLQAVKRGLRSMNEIAAALLPPNPLTKRD